MTIAIIMVMEKPGHPTIILMRMIVFSMRLENPYRNIDSLNQISNYSPVAAWGSSAYDANIFSGDNVTGAVKDGLDNDRDSDDFSDVDGNGFPWTDNNDNGLFDVGIDAVEAGAKLINGTHIFVYADGIDNDGDGKSMKILMKESMKHLKIIVTK